MKKILVGISLISLLFFTAGCAAHQRHFSVESSFITPYFDEELWTFYVLSPDGNSLTFSDLSQIELETGNRDRPFDDILSQDWQDEHDVLNLHWSSDGRYLAITTQSLRLNPNILMPVYIVDTKDKVVSEPLDIAPFYSWSPFNNQYAIASSMDTIAFKPIIYHMEDFSPVSYKTTILNKTNNLGGSGSYLWNQEINMPIGEIDVRDPINFAGTLDDQEIGVIMFQSGKDGEIDWDLSSSNLSFISSPPDNIVHYSFAPSGKFILILQWQCSGEGEKQCSLHPDHRYLDSVEDSVLILLDWQTGETQELIRLSEIDAENVVGFRLQWSADGSTVLVSRKDSAPVILEIGDY